MVKCGVCLEKTGESKNFHCLTLHLIQRHGMTTRHYRSLYPHSKIVSKQFRQKQRDLMIKKRKKYKDLSKRQNQWRKLKSEDRYDDLEPTMDTLEALQERIDYLRYRLVTGIKGEEYKRSVRELMEARQAYERLFTRYCRQQD